MCALRFAYDTLSQTLYHPENASLPRDNCYTISDFLCDVIYGSKLMDRLDKRILRSLASALFKPNSLELQNVPEISHLDHSGTLFPKRFELQDLLDWSETSISNNDPKFLGLSSTMNSRMLLLQGKDELSRRNFLYLIL
jgi:hypothetical protein